MKVIPVTFLSSLGYGGQVIGALVILIGALLLWLLVRFLITRSVRRVQSGYTVFKKPHFKWAQPVLRPFDSARRVQRAETIGGLLSSVAAGTIAIIAILMALGTLGINIVPILTSVGIVGIAIGFGAREVIRDAFLGFFITLEDQYGIGDTIEIGDTVGVVQSLGLRITRMVDADGAIWYVRNGDITKVGNRSQGDYVAPAPSADPTDADRTGQGSSTQTVPPSRSPSPVAAGSTATAGPPPAASPILGQTPGTPAGAAVGTPGSGPGPVGGSTAAPTGSPAGPAGGSTVAPATPSGHTPAGGSAETERNA